MNSVREQVFKSFSSGLPDKDVSNFSSSQTLIPDSDEGIRQQVFDSFKHDVGQDNFNKARSSGISPETELGFRKMADRLGVPVDQIRLTPDKYKRFNNQETYNELSKSSPNTASLMLSYNDALLAQDDLPNLQEQEKNINDIGFFVSTYNKIKTGIMNFSGAISANRLYNMANELADTQDGIRNADILLSKSGDSLPSDVLKDTEFASIFTYGSDREQQLKDWEWFKRNKIENAKKELKIESKVYSEIRKDIGSIPQADVFRRVEEAREKGFAEIAKAIGGDFHTYALGTFLESAWLTSPATLAGVAVAPIPVVGQAAQPLIVALNSYIVDRDSEFIENLGADKTKWEDIYSALIDKDRVTKANDMAFRHAAPVGTMDAIGVLMANAVAGKFGGRMIAKSLNSMPISRAIGAFVGGTALDAASGGGGEALGQYWQHGKITDYAAITGEIVGGLPNASVETGFAMYSNVKVDLTKARSAINLAPKLNALFESARNSKYRQRDPEGYTRHLNNQTNNQFFSQSIYIDIETAEEAGIVNQIAERSQSAKDQIEQMKKNGTRGDIVIPLSEAVGMGADIGDNFQNNIRLTPDGFSYNEAQKFNDSYLNTLAKDIEKANKQSVELSQRQAEHMSVVDSIRNELTTNTVMTPKEAYLAAEIQGAVYTNLARALGISPEVFYKTYKINFDSSMKPSGMKVRMLDRQALSDLHPQLHGAIDEALGARTEEDRYKALLEEAQRGDNDLDVDAVAEQLAKATQIREAADAKVNQIAGTDVSRAEAYTEGRSILDSLDIASNDAFNASMDYQKAKKLLKDVNEAEKRLANTMEELKHAQRIGDANKAKRLQKKLVSNQRSLNNKREAADGITEESLENLKKISAEKNKAKTGLLNKRRAFSNKQAKEGGKTLSQLVDDGTVERKEVIKEVADLLMKASHGKDNLFRFPAILDINDDREHTNVTNAIRVGEKGRRTSLVDIAEGLGGHWIVDADENGEPIWVYDGATGHAHLSLKSKTGQKAKFRYWVNDKKIAVDASEIADGLKKGENTHGVELVEIALAFCHRFNLKFEGDRQGLSKLGRIRLGEMLLSSALKYGTTEHISPASNFLERDEEHNIDGVEWEDGNDLQNIAQLLVFNYKNVKSALPKVADLWYNFNTGKFEERGNNGKNKERTARELFRTLSKSEQKTAREVGIGSGTIARSVLAKSLFGLLEQEGSRTRDGVLDRVGAIGVQSLLDSPALNEAFHQKAEFKKRLIEKGRYSRPDRLIRFLKDADFSTFVHESSHHYLDTIALIASMDNAPQEVKDMMNTILDWFGVDSLETWNNMSIEEQRIHHEKFASGSEVYMIEGKAPTDALGKIFYWVQRFMQQIYASAQAIKDNYKKVYGEELVISDDIRNVFDRLYASDTEIGIMQSDDVLNAVMTLDDLDEVGDAQAVTDLSATMKAMDKLRSAVIKDAAFASNAQANKLNEIRRQFRMRREEIMKDISDDVEQMPIFQAKRMLPSIGFLSAKSIQDLFDSIDTAQVAEGHALVELARKAGFVQKKGKGYADHHGMDVAVIAEMFGYSDPIAFVEDLIKTPSEEVYIKNEVDRKMLEEFGTASTPEKLTQQAEMAVYNEVRLRALATEAMALGNQEGGVRGFLSIVRDLVRGNLGKTKIKDISPSRFRANVARAGKKFLEALSNGENEKAAQHRKQQTIHAVGVDEAHKTLNRLERDVKYLKNFYKKAKEKALPNHHLEQIRSLLDKFDLTRKKSDVTPKKTLSEWVQQQLDRGQQPEVSMEILPKEEQVKLSQALEDNSMTYEQIVIETARAVESMRETQIREMTLDQFNALVSTVKHIEKLGRTESLLIAGEKAMAFEAIKSEMLTAIDNNRAGEGMNERDPSTFLNRFKSLASRFFWQNIKATILLGRLDGYNDTGIFQRVMLAPAEKASVRETQLTAEIHSMLEEAFKPLNSLVTRFDRLFGVEINSLTSKKTGKPTKMSFDQRFAVLLNLGNPENAQQLMNGNQFTAENIQEILDSLPDEAFTAAQKVWDAFEQLKQEMEKLEIETQGKAPKWVEAKPITIKRKDGKQISLRGGYYPIIYDSTNVETMNLFDMVKDATTADFAGGIGRLGNTRTNRVKERSARRNNAAIMLDLSGMKGGLTDIIHDICFRKWSIDSAKVLNDRDIRAAILDAYGTEVYDVLKTWQDNVVNGSRRMKNALADFIAFSRQNLALSRLGFSASTMLLQPIGIMMSIPRVGGAHILRSMCDFLSTGYVGLRKEVLSKSAFMQTRDMTQSREINEITSSLTSVDKMNLRRKATTYGYWGMLRTQQMVDVITWNAMYNRCLSEGMNEEDAITVADRAVRDAQGSGEKISLPALMNGNNPLNDMFTAFYGFMNTKLNNTYRIWSDKDKAIGTKLLNTLQIFTFQFVLEECLRAMFRKRDQDGDQDGWWSWMWWALTSHVKEGLGLFPVLRDIASGIEGHPVSPAGLSTIMDIGSLFGAINAKATGDERDKGKVLNTLNNLAGDLTGFPSVQARRTAVGFNALKEGKTNNPFALVTGSDK